MMTSSIKTKILLQGLFSGILVMALFAVIGVFFPSERNEIEFSRLQAADIPIEYVELAAGNDAVPVTSGRFQLSRILQQLQLRLSGAFRLLTPRELLKAMQNWHTLLLSGLCACHFLRASLRSKLLFHLYLNSITPCRAGPLGAVL